MSEDSVKGEEKGRNKRTNYFIEYNNKIVIEKKKWNDQLKAALNPIQVLLEGFRDWKKRSLYDLVRSYVSSSLMIHEALALG